MCLSVFECKFFIVLYCIVLNFGSLTKKLQACMLTHPKSTINVLHMLRHTSSGHTTLLRGEFQQPIFSPNRIYGAGQIHVGLCPKFLVIINLMHVGDGFGGFCKRNLHPVKNRKEGERFVKAGD